MDEWPQEEDGCEKGGQRHSSQQALQTKAQEVQQAERFLQAAKEQAGVRAGQLNESGKLLQLPHLWPLLHGMLMSV